MVSSQGIMNRSSILWVFSFVGLVFSCAPNQQGDFRSLSQEEMPEDKAVVYLYRPASAITSAGLCNLKLNDEVVGALNSGEYTVCFIAPGKTRVEAAKPYGAFVTVNVKENKQYFIRQKWALRPTGYNPVIEHMTDIRAQPEIGRCWFVKRPKVVDVTDSEEKDGNS